MHVVAVLHDTPLSAAPVADAGWGIVRTFQVVPFHCSASATV